MTDQEHTKTYEQHRVLVKDEDLLDFDEYAAQYTENTPSTEQTALGFHEHLAQWPGC